MEGSETILFIGSHYEVKGSEITKYYTSAPLSAGLAGATRVAVRKYSVPSSSELTYLLGDHLGSTSLATDETGTLLVETRYKAWGEVRYTTESSTLPTRYTYTGQYSYISDEATDLGSLGFGLMYYGARFYDPATGRFSSADTIIPEQTQGTQAWDRYAYVNNNPIRNADPTGHIGEDCGDNPETCKDIPTQPEPPTCIDGGWCEPEYSTWNRLRLGSPCTACHVTHWTGRIPKDGEIDPNLVEYYRSMDPIAGLVHAYGFYQAGQLGSAALRPQPSTIQPNGSNYPGTTLPESFTLSGSDYDFYVPQSGTKHMAELLSGPAGKTDLAAQMVLGSFDEAVGNAVSQGFQYNTLVQSGSWELIFSPSRGAGMLPAIIHALYIP